MALELAFTPPFDPGIFSFLAARAVTGVEEADATSYARTIALTGGRGPMFGTHGWFRVSWDGTALWLDFELEDPSSTTDLLLAVRHLFNLDHDPVAADAALSADPLLAPRVAAVPGIRLPGCVDSAEILIRAMVGQQITVAAARTALNQLMPLATPSRLPHGTMTHVFAAPGEIAAGGRAILRGPQRRIDSILTVSALLANGTLAFGEQDTLDSLHEKLLPLPGIGPWTVGYVAMRVLGNSNIFLPTDAAVRNGYGLLRGDSLAEARTIKAAELARMAAPLQPWQSYLTLHLWRVAGEK
ncbi:AlkA N-terminal domain-containing protein [Arthrobacter sp. lap29]|uniref:DNA-3-methyladenine glycosylase family protein n=1 Tax=Arthrobacter sp. lap29 TaxID=3056122 RepID=UPI0028F6D1AF|nr:AlkA N-terminal domain-containing protein [Arthrobacter sp. lap29]